MGTQLWRIVVVTLALSLAACGRSSPPDPTSPPAASGTSGSAAGDSQSRAPILEASSDPDQPTRVLDPRADRILRKMSATLTALQTFALEAEESFDEIPSGQPRILLTNVRRVAVQRPNRFAADAHGDSLNRSVWYDGRSIAVWDKATNSYSTVDVPDSIDGALKMLADKYGVDVPLADLLYSNPYEVLTEGATYSRYMGIHTAANVPCHHLVFAQPTIEWQIWIDAGEHPLPRKLVITYVRETGEPQYLATIWAWRLSPTFPDSIFRFEAPAGAERVEIQAFVPGVPGPSQ